MKKKLSILFLTVMVILLIIGGYVTYVFLDYYRLPDQMDLAVSAREEAVGERENAACPQTGETYQAVSYNIGFGAYTPDYSFFMDGGTQSWAKDEESVYAAVSGAAQLVMQEEPELVLFQEVDVDGTRSYHVNELDILKQFMGNREYVFAQNFDSPFLFWPLYQPHGKNRAGMVTCSTFPIASGLRRSLPIATSLSRLVDLDRCYSIIRIPTANGKELCVFNVHLSAYGTNDEVRGGQRQMLYEDMGAEYQAGNYVICGGDFNHDLKAAEDATSAESWAYPMSRSTLPAGISFAMDQLTQEEKEALHNSCRNADAPYAEGESYTVTVDGFLISDNIELVSYINADTGYQYSDHDPVIMEFQLKEQ